MGNGTKARLKKIEKGILDLQDRFTNLVAITGQALGTLTKPQPIADMNEDECVVLRDQLTLGEIMLWVESDLDIPGRNQETISYISSCLQQGRKVRPTAVLSSYPLEDQDEVEEQVQMTAHRFLLRPADVISKVKLIKELKEASEE